MRTRPLLVIAVGLVTVFGVTVSVIGTVGQLTDFRPIRANGAWQSDRGATGTWSAELKLDGRVLSGDIVVVGHEAFGTGQFQATLVRNGNLENAELTFGGESLANVSGRLARDSLDGSFQIGAIESGQWSGDWPGVPPQGGEAVTQESAEGPLRAQASEADGTGVHEKVDIELPKVTVETNRLASVEMDFGNLQREVEVAVDRSGVTNRVALAAIDQFLYPEPHPETPDLAYYISPDGGNTWPDIHNEVLMKGVPPGLEPADVAPLGIFVQFGADPVVDYDRNGDLYYCGLVFDNDPPVGTGDSAVFVSRMPAQPPKPIPFLNATIVRALPYESGIEADKPWCATGLTPEPTPRDIIYVTWSEFERPPISRTKIKAAYSLDAGATFIGLTTVSDDGPSDPTDPFWPQVEVNPDTHSVNFVWLANGVPDPCPSGVECRVDIKFDRCSFAGEGMQLSCGTDVNVKEAFLRPDQRLPGTNFLMSWFPYLATSKSNTGTGLIYVIWTEKKSLNGDTDIRFRRSDGQSINFVAERVVAGTSEDEFFPAITVDENFFIRVVYLRRVGSSTDDFNVYSVFSGDAGLTWNGPTQLNDGGNISPDLPDGDNSIGDYIGIDAKAERHAGWMDSRRAPAPTPSFDAYSAVFSGC